MNRSSLQVQTVHTKTIILAPQRHQRGRKMQQLGPSRLQTSHMPPTNEPRCPPQPPDNLSAGDIQPSLYQSHQQTDRRIEAPWPHLIHRLPSSPSHDSPTDIATTTYECPILLPQSLPAHHDPECSKYLKFSQTATSDLGNEERHVDSSSINGRHTDRDFLGSNNTDTAIPERSQEALNTDLQLDMIQTGIDETRCFSNTYQPTNFIQQKLTSYYRPINELPPKATATK
jgi:hypothetical protein